MTNNIQNVIEGAPGGLRQLSAWLKSWKPHIIRLCFGNGAYLGFSLSPSFSSTHTLTLSLSKKKRKEKNVVGIIKLCFKVTLWAETTYIRWMYSNSRKQSFVISIKIESNLLLQQNLAQWNWYTSKVLCNFPAIIF